MAATLQKIVKNVRQELNDRNIVKDSQNAKNKETSKQNPNNITKTTGKNRDEEKSCKKSINGRMEHTAVRKNKVTNNISDIKNVKNGEE